MSAVKAQRRRPALARAPLLILDEASACLDVAAEAERARVVGDQAGGWAMIVVSRESGILKGTDHGFRLAEPVHA